jgi:hypothetical protein
MWPVRAQSSGARSAEADLKFMNVKLQHGGKSDTMAGSAEKAAAQTSEWCCRSQQRKKPQNELTRMKNPVYNLRLS